MLSRQDIDALAHRLRPHYRRFLDGLDDDVLLTGHSHQAWPDVSRDAHLRAWDDAATQIDGKWGKILSELLPSFQRGIARRIGSSRPDDIALAPNTHELVYRLLSCLPHPPKVLTTSSEFHSLNRQLDRLIEDGAQVTRVDAESPTFANQMIDALDAGAYDLVALSMVLFTTSRVIGGIDELLRAAERRGVPVLLDAYHAFNAIPMNADAHVGQVFVTGGGYKYAQSGEGVCWMSLPADAAEFRPRTTGWFADFASLESGASQVQYGAGGYRFFGATFDPAGLYRGEAVMRWMDEVGLDVPTLRRQSLLQSGLLIEQFDELGLKERGLTLATPREASQRGAFVSIRTPEAADVSRRLGEAGVRMDTRQDLLRFGPAPYTTSAEIVEGMSRLAQIVG